MIAAAPLNPCAAAGDGQGHPIQERRWHLPAWAQSLKCAAAAPQEADPRPAGALNY